MLAFTDAEPKYLVAVQPIPTNDVKKHCTGTFFILIKYWQSKNSPWQDMFSGKYATGVILNQWECLKTFT